MNLIDLISNIDEVDEDSIIFLKDLNDYKSDIILSYPEDGDNGIKKENDTEYYYLIEVFLAKEFISDWIDSLDYSPSIEDIAKRLYEYGINDA
ncbi:hypothetical protein SAMN05421841_2683 [Chryseobacterium wanjuense]|jgi:hypothetical protein|uniref:Uncharacterized protein n=1 Tax=Chryseobacterium wanjuense TaxID=356305 RepID=A0A1I0RIZ8_9FLAO|nr:hypothetical protein [Chryseobacterium wanjuense]SEW40239.1 hypothetical protein SAMN05421841_2683 [Chryseobacterium wanjuense]